MRVLCYTRLPMEDAIYSEKLAYSMHLALQETDGRITSQIGRASWRERV